jgi:4-hydroxy-tetrahydrodipicolinate synthase
MAGVIYCGSMGDWPLLTDEQRMTGVEGLVKAGLRVIVGTGAQNPMRAAALAAHANKVGAAGLMVIPRVLSRGSSAAAQYAHFAGILEAGGNLPAVIYNSPYYGFETKADLFFALPKEVLHLASLCEKAAMGDATARQQALELEGALRVLSTFDVGVDLVLFFKYLMVLEGHREYELHFNPTDSLSESQKRFARNQLELFKRWYAAWVKH